VTSTGIYLAESVEWDLIRWATASWPKETGGLLAGVWAGSRPWITMAIEVPGIPASESNWSIAGGATRRVILRVRKRDPRIGYFGDWHSHPRDCGPSVLDARSMARTLSQTTGRPPLPIMLLVRRHAESYVVEAHRSTGRELTSVEIKYTGNLSSFQQEVST